LRTDSGGDDLFLPPGELRKAMHGDRVLASVTGVDRRGRREGAIVEVLERRLTRIIGRYGERNGIGFVAPDDRRVLHDVMIPPDAREGAREGQLVVCEIVEPPRSGRPPFGRILTVLGDKLTPSLVVEAAIHGHGMPHEFPQETLDEATAVPVTSTRPHRRARGSARRAAGHHRRRGRQGFRRRGVVRSRPQGRLPPDRRDRRCLAYVKPGSALDDEAQNRATSVYFPGFVVPMLPETLSNGICSLKPEVDAAVFRLRHADRSRRQCHRSKFYEAVMRSHARLTYTRCGRRSATGDPDAIADIGALMPQIEALHQLFQVLAKARAKRGAIEFETSEVRFVLGPAGDVVQAGMLERNDAHKLIEECMIAANVEAAKFLLKHGIPAPYRIHDRPPEQKYAELLEFLGEFGLRMPPWQKVVPRDFTALMTKVRARADGGADRIGAAALAEPGRVRAENIGHFGLALSAYAHFTSPIRRYPDLLVHRAIKHALAGGRESDFRYAKHHMDALSLQCSERGRRAEEAEREVDERYRCAWMEQHVGSEFDGAISGVTSFGLFVELTAVEGQWPGARDAVAERLLPLRSDPQAADRRTHRCGVSTRRSGACGGHAREPGRPSHRFPLGRKRARFRRGAYAEKEEAMGEVKVALLAHQHMRRSMP
jgi:ribonuclease R